ncbi:MAG: chromate efflux transporter [Planctomycetes bacterium]|nr:chromate efflux transporter [Planctomycetota bacterium]
MQRTPLRTLAALFLRLGATSFGGPAAHTAMMHDEVVRRRGWLDEQRFLDLLGAANLIPGPTSTELAIHVGYERAGWRGLLVAGLCFLLPAVLLTGAFAWLYVESGSLPAVGAVLHGCKPVVVAVVLQAIAGLAPKAARTPPLAVLGLLSALAVALGAGELYVLAGAGLAAVLLRRGSGAAVALPLGGHALLPAAAGAGAATAAVTAVTASIGGIFVVFLKIGSVLFGSGYVLLAFLRADLVERLGWLTEAQLVDAIAVGQFTPGPVFSTATFVGYLLAGVPGAAAATAGIFLPAFVFVALSGPLLPRLRRSPRAGAVLDGVNVASLALMVVVTVQLARVVFVDVFSVVLGLVAAVLLLRWRVNSSWLVLGGAAAGWLWHALGLAG